jgi:hypothetical protein
MSHVAKNAYNITIVLDPKDTPSLEKLVYVDVNYPDDGGGMPHTQVQVVEFRNQLPLLKALIAEYEACPCGQCMDATLAVIANLAHVCGNPKDRDCEVRFY